jgi:hypothetical protein
MRSWLNHLDVRRVVAGGLLVGIAGVVGAAGVALCGAAIFRATQLRLRDLDVPLSETTRRNTRRLGHAARAGAVAWHDGRRP